MGTTWKDNMFQWKNIMEKKTMDQNKKSIAIQCKITVT